MREYKIIKKQGYFVKNTPMCTILIYPLNIKNILPFTKLQIRCSLYVFFLLHVARSRKTMQVTGTQ